MATKKNTLTTIFDGDPGPFNKAAARVQNTGRSLGQSMLKLRGLFMGAFATAGIAKMIDHLDRVAKVATRLGISGERLQKLTFAVKQSGGTFTQLQAILTRLDRRVGDALTSSASAAAKAFGRLGINVKDIVDLDVDKKFMVVADAFKSIENRSEATSALLQLLDTEVRELIPTMLKGSEGLNSLMAQGQAITDQQLKNIERLKDTWGEFKNWLMGGLGAGIGVISKGLGTWQAGDFERNFREGKQNEERIKRENAERKALQKAGKEIPMRLGGPMSLEVSGAGGKPGIGKDRTAIASWYMMSDAERKFAMDNIGRGTSITRDIRTVEDVRRGMREQKAAAAYTKKQEAKFAAEAEMKAFNEAGGMKSYKIPWGKWGSAIAGMEITDDEGKKTKPFEALGSFVKKQTDLGNWSKWHPKKVGKNLMTTGKKMSEAPGEIVGALKEGYDAGERKRISDSLKGSFDDLFDKPLNTGSGKFGEFVAAASMGAGGAAITAKTPVVTALDKMLVEQKKNKEELKALKDLIESNTSPFR